MSMHFEYELTGAGWSKCVLNINDNVLNLSASYLSDALRSLVAATCRILEGNTDSTARFDEEPGEYRWRFFRTDDHTMRIQVIEFQDLGCDKPDSEGILIYDQTIRIRTFAGALYDKCTTLLSIHGLDGYKKLWVKHDFPVIEVEHLRKLLKG